MVSENTTTLITLTEARQALEAIFPDGGFSLSARIASHPRQYPTPHRSVTQGFSFYALGCGVPSMDSPSLSSLVVAVIAAAEAKRAAPESVDAAAANLNDESSQRTDDAATKPGGGTPPATLPRYFTADRAFDSYYRWDGAECVLVSDEGEHDAPNDMTAASVAAGLIVEGTRRIPAIELTHAEVCEYHRRWGTEPPPAPDALTATLDARDETRKGPTVYVGNSIKNVQVSP